MPLLADRSAALEQEFLPLLGTDFIEFYAGNAKQAAHYYRTAFGMRLAAYQGPETGVRDRASYVLEQGRIRFVITTALRPNHPVADHVHRHGDGVRCIALRVEDAGTAYAEVKSRGARILSEPTELRDGSGVVRMFSIAAYGETVHTFVERGRYEGVFLPGYSPPGTVDTLSRPAGLKHIDHMVANVAKGEMNRWAAFYENVLGFKLYQHFDDHDISTPYSALMSKVMANGNGRVKFPINEPASGLRKSQIEEYLDFHQGPGVQHIALATDDIIDTVSQLRSRGVEFLEVPAAYYEALSTRIGRIDEPLDQLATLGILADRDEEGYLLQIFTKPVEDRPTLFYEIIERKGSRGFGKGNFQALFVALEAEQARRGNL